MALLIQLWPSFLLITVLVIGITKLRNSMFLLVGCLKSRGLL